MSTITIKNIPSDLYEMLKLQAKRNHRSINSEIIFTLKKVLGFRETDENEKVIQQARQFRQKVKVSLSEGEINEAKRSGRK